MRKLIVHIILIFLIVVILFPTVWVVTTSLRRDEAAFSSELFSSRLTLQNYIDLVVPEKNLPVLVQELHSLISRAKPFSELDPKKAAQKVEDDLERFHRYLQESSSRYVKAEESYRTIDDYLKKNAQTVRDLTLKNLDGLKKVLLEETKSFEANATDHYSVVLYEYLSKEKFDSQIFKVFKEDLQKIIGFEIKSAEEFNAALGILKERYDNYIGRLKENLNEISAKFDQLKKTSSNLKDKISPVQDQVLKTDLILKNALLPELENTVEALENLKNLKDSVRVSSTKRILPLDDSFFFESLFALSEGIEKVLQKLDVLTDYTALKKSVERMADLLKELSNIDEANDRSKMLYSDFIKSYQELQPRIERILNDVDSALSNLGDSAVLLHDTNEQLIQISKEMSLLEQEKTKIEEEIKNLESQLETHRRLCQLKVFLAELDQRISTVNSITSFGRTDLVRYSALISWLRNFMNSYSLKDEIYTILRKTVDDLRWIEEYRTFSSRFENVSKNLQEVLSQTNSLLSDFEKSWSYLLDVSYSGVFVRSEHLSKLDDVVRSEFVNKVRSDLAVVMRKAGVLMKLTPFSDLKNHFERIDRELYRIDQVWKQKTKHYFLRWVANSVIISLIVALITTFVCAVAAYPFSRMRFAGRRYGIMAFLLIQMFPGVIFMVAIYNLLNFLGKYVTFLGVDTVGGLIFAYLTNISYNMYLIKGFYDLIPSSLEEAAIVDGATRFQSFYKIVLPLARPILTVVFLLVFIGTFNEYVVARIILQNVQNYTYALGLQSFAVGPYETEWGLFTAAALLGMLPMVILFLSLQRYLVSGLTRGAVKE
ncbi:MAG: ABC transporter permease subunit [Pseudothermotoga sp.]